MPAPFAVYAIRYATVERQPGENFIGGAPGGDAHEGSMPMDYFVWVAISNDRTWVIDTGFNRRAADRRKRQFLRCPTEGLQLLGVDAQTVEDVIITHLHYDHIGNFDLFPRARFHLQDSEMAYATGRHMANRFFSGAYEEDEVVAMVRNVYSGRVCFHDGDVLLDDNISLHHVGGHTLGLQVVRVWTESGWLVLASDASHYRANMDSNRPFPIVADVTEMVQGWQKVRELADSERLIIPGHDPRVMQEYPAAGPGMEGIVVRLDK